MKFLKVPSELEIQCKTMCPLYTMCPHTFEPPTYGVYPPLGLTPSTVAQFISPPRRCQSMTFEKVRIFRLLTNA